MSYLPWNITDWYNEHVVVGSKQALEIENAPQGSELWHDARKLRASGSRVGSMVGLGYYGTTAKSLTSQFVWPGHVANKYTRWGNDHEVCAQKLCEEVLIGRFGETFKVTFEYPGGIVISGDEWFIASVDGLCHLRDKATGTLVETMLLEFKCPQTIRAGIKQEYYAQVQSYLGFLQRHSQQRFYTLRRCIFAQWTHERMTFAEYTYNHDWFTEMRTEARAVYFEEILPRLMLKAAGLLQPNCYRLMPKVEQHEGQESLSKTVETRDVGGNVKIAVETGVTHVPKRFRSA